MKQPSWIFANVTDKRMGSEKGVNTMRIILKWVVKRRSASFG